MRFLPRPTTRWERLRADDMLDGGLFDLREKLGGGALNLKDDGPSYVLYPIMTLATSSSLDENKMILIKPVPCTANRT